MCVCGGGGMSWGWREGGEKKKGKQKEADGQAASKEGKN